MIIEQKWLLEWIDGWMDGWSAVVRVYEGNTLVMMMMMMMITGQ